MIPSNRQTINENSSHSELVNKEIILADFVLGGKKIEWKNNFLKRTGSHHIMNANFVWERINITLP